MQIDHDTYNKARRYAPGHGYEARKAAPVSVVVHSTSNPNQKNTPFVSEANYLYTAPLVGAHFLIGKVGNVVQFLDPEKWAAWHAGNARDGYKNQQSIGIELHHSVGDPPYPRQQLDALRELVRSLMILHRIPLTLVETHGQIAIKGPYDRKHDPSDMTYAGFLAWRASVAPEPVHPASNLITPASLILWEPRATPEQCLTYILSRPHGEYTEYDVRSIIGGYYGQAAGIDPLLAIAQCIHETGGLSSWWAARPRRNPAGLGVTGETNAATQPGYVQDGAIWRRGLTFDSWQASARAHLGRLLAYALPAGHGTPAQRTLIDEALRLRGLDDDLRGAATQLSGLDGRWAYPGVGYSQRIADIANAIRATKGV